MFLLPECTYVAFSAALTTTLCGVLALLLTNLFAWADATALSSTRIAPLTSHWSSFGKQ